MKYQSWRLQDDKKALHCEPLNVVSCRRKEVVVGADQYLQTANEQDTVLIVEDSTTFSALLSRRINQTLALKTVVAGTLKEAISILSERSNEFCVAVLDLNLPDASEGEIITPVLSYGIPVIVFTGNCSDALRKKLLDRNVVDYITKESLADIDYLLKLIARLRKNCNTKIMVVDDSSTTRLYITNLLRLRNFQVVEADGGMQALELLQQHPDVKLVITDFNMPEMDGLELTRRIRIHHKRDRLSIIGISALGSGALSAQFLKKGANDFLTKPFVNEEFSYRIEQNLELMEHIEEISFLSQKDYLTGLGNRRYFFDSAPKLLAAAKKEGKNVGVSMLDIDFFKKVNDTYGHDGGDEALRHLSLILREFEAPRTLVSRFGGEEFCILIIDENGDSGERVENLRKRVEESSVCWLHGSFSITVSIGHTCGPVMALEKMLSKADELLYSAKQSGRNRVVQNNMNNQRQ